MDKNTLSNYGWIVIAVLVLSVMIALATPFGSYIEQGVRSTTAGLFETSEKALNVVGMSAGSGDFEDGYTGVGGSGTTPSEPEIPKVEGSATFSKYITLPGCHDLASLHDDSCYTECESITLTWEALKLTENGEKYGYDASDITDDSIGDRAFCNCTSLRNIIIPDSVTSIEIWAFSCCKNLTNIVIPDSVTSIGYSAFRICTSLTNIIIPDSVTSIGYGAFEGCESLTNIVLPDSITNIEKTTFSNCKSLTNIVIPDSVTTIGIHAFSDCHSLTRVVIPNSVTSIKANAFSCCKNLTSIVIPNSVTSIGDYAFEVCDKLKNITFNGSIDDWNNINFGYWNDSNPGISVECTDGTIIPVFETEPDNDDGFHIGGGDGGE